MPSIFDGAVTAVPAFGLQPRGGAAPQLDRGIFKLPDRFGKAARETKTDYFAKSINDILGAGTDYANWITATEEGRRTEAIGTLKEGAAAFDKSPLSREDIASIYSGQSDRAARTYKGNLHDLRASLGATGVGPDSGYATAMASRYEANRQASLTDATKSLLEKRIDLDVNNRLSQWSAKQAIAARQASDPSVIGLDWLGQAGTILEGEQGIIAQGSAARHAEDAAKQAGTMSAIGSGVSGLTSLLTAL